MLKIRYPLEEFMTARIQRPGDAEPKDHPCVLIRRDPDAALVELVEVDEVHHVPLSAIDGLPSATAPAPAA